MRRDRASARAFAALAAAVVIAVALSGCAGEIDAAERAQAQVSAKERALADAEAAFATASDEFCGASRTYIESLDRYGDVLHSTAPTVGDVRTAGADLVEPQQDALAGAEAALEAREAVVDAQQELVEAQAALAAAQPTVSAAPTAAPSPPPGVPEASVARVQQAEEDFASAVSSISDDTALSEASERFNAAVVALELSWLRLFIDAGCVSDEQAATAAAAVAAYTAALQQDLADAGFFSGEIDGVYGPSTVQAVEDLQSSAGLPVTGTVDKATAEALQDALVALGHDAAGETIASTAAVQQTLALAGFWDGPIDGEWTPELTEAVKEFQRALGVEPTGQVDAATVAAFDKALSELTAEPSPEPTEEPTPEPTPSATP